MKRRVVVTGMAGLTPLGSEWSGIRERLLSRRSAVAVQAGWEALDGMRTHLGAAVEGFGRPRHYSRRQVRSMGRVALMAVRATELALERAGLSQHPALVDGTTGIAYGSTSGSPPAVKAYVERIAVDHTTSGLTGANFIQAMSHTCAANLAQFFGVQGRIVSTCTACTAGSQGIGYGYEAVAFGKHDVMITGGAEELSQAGAAIFDILFATSTRNHEPERTPRPFDRDRDGLVVGEGAATLILESYDHARARGAEILAEVAGFGTNCDGRHVVNPSPEGMQSVMQLALADAGLAPDAIDYVNAHATATEVGDIAESIATRACFGRAVAISSLKSYMGHTLGACGAIEAWLCIEMMNEGWLPPTINLDHVDERCAALDYITEAREQTIEHFLSNNFAFGGVNTSLVFKKP